MPSETRDEVWELEEGEDAFFSSWCDVMELDGAALLLLNPTFREDWLFNHATRIRCQPQQLKGLVKRIEERFLELDIRPCIYSSPLSSPSNLGIRLMGLGYERMDGLVVMELREGPKVKGGGGGNEGGGVRGPSEGTLRAEEARGDGPWPQLYAQGFGLTKEELEGLVRLMPRLKAQGIRPFLAFKEGEAIGTFALYKHGDAVGIYCVAILEGWRGRGLGSAMMRIAIGLARELGKRIYLQCIESSGLVSFYARLGFVKLYTKGIYSKYSR